jgi:hypothetical protein
VRLDDGDQLAPVEARRIDLDGHAAGVDVHPRRAHPGQRRQRTLDRVLAVIAVDLWNQDGHRRHGLSSTRVSS